MDVHSAAGGGAGPRPASERLRERVAQAIAAGNRAVSEVAINYQRRILSHIAVTRPLRSAA